ncbi:uncharacterized protein TM35_000093480 [Trypanosoma theileri]|uniref:Uncharacterized protein n=1 Tax=Trypanosoma theileri TaxID=67003 RepID=A0A1X0P0H2_9TRYP|nr:uncharacterized protein TM35_000093480 [Trypanosoma theileri]ORC90298.1 hypothetical protein TM35_000093480 [Trypanosoma theileri]
MGMLETAPPTVEYPEYVDPWKNEENVQEQTTHTSGNEHVTQPSADGHYANSASKTHIKRLEEAALQCCDMSQHIIYTGVVTDESIAAATVRAIPTPTTLNIGTEYHQSGTTTNKDSPGAQSAVHKEEGVT